MTVGDVMVKVSVFYDSKYGNTKLVAEKIAEGLKSECAEVDLGYVKKMKLSSVICSDAIVLGAPNHMARPSRTMKQFIDYLATVDLKATQVAVFSTYAGKERPVDRAVKKLELMVQMKLPSLKLLQPALSVRVNGVKGPVIESELPKSFEFGRAIAGQLGT